MSLRCRLCPDATLHLETDRNCFYIKTAHCVKSPHCSTTADMVAVISVLALVSIFRDNEKTAESRFAKQLCLKKNKNQQKN